MRDPCALLFFFLKNPGPPRSSLFPLTALLRTNWLSLVPFFDSPPPHRLCRKGYLQVWRATVTCCCRTSDHRLVASRWENRRWASPTNQREEALVRPRRRWSFPEAVRAPSAPAQNEKKL